MKRNIQLDVLRGIAILLVIGVHIDIQTPGGWLGKIAGVWHSLGGFGVPLFFTLSGYLIGGLLITELRTRGCVDVRRFLVRRGLKIYPAYLAFLSYLLAMPTAKAILGGRNPLGVVLPLVSEYWPNVLFINNYIGSNPAGHTWSLAVEEHFYLILPFLIVVFARIGRIRTLVMVCLLSPIACTAIRLMCAYCGDYYIHALDRTMAASHLLFDGLLIGVGMRGAVEFYPGSIEGIRRIRYILVVAGIVLLAGTTYGAKTVFCGVPLSRIVPFQTVCAAALLGGALHIRASDFGWAGPTASFAARCVAWIGVYSYSTYLWHTTVMGVVAREVLGKLPWKSCDGSIWLVYAAILTGCIVGGGFVAARIVEWPVLRLRERVVPAATGQSETIGRREPPKGPAVRPAVIEN